VAWESINRVLLESRKTASTSRQCCLTPKSACLQSRGLSISKIPKCTCDKTLVCVYLGNTQKRLDYHITFGLDHTHLMQLTSTRHSLPSLCLASHRASSLLARSWKAWRCCCSRFCACSMAFLITVWPSAGEATGLSASCWTRAVHSVTA